MHEVTVHRLDTDPSVTLTFQPLDAKGNPAPPAGPVTWTGSDGTIGEIQLPQPRNPCLVSILGKVGTDDITATDGVATVLVHLVIDGSVETDATVIAS